MSDPSDGDGRHATFHWGEYLCELLGTAILCFVGLSAVTINFGSDSPTRLLIPNESARLLLTGLCFAGSGSLIAISPVGKLSGAHLNPGVTIAFWIRRKMHSVDAISYMAAQFIGACLGCWLLMVVWGPRAESVHFGVTQPGPMYSWLTAAAVEFAITAFYMTLIFFFVSSRRLMTKTPLMSWLVVAGLVWREAPISGTSLNAARSFGPAWVAHDWRYYGIYLIFPTAGAAFAAVIFPLLQRDEKTILTGKLFHSPHYPSLFKNVPKAHALDPEA